MFDRSYYGGIISGGALHPSAESEDAERRAYSLDRFGSKGRVVQGVLRGMSRGRCEGKRSNDQIAEKFTTRLDASFRPQRRSVPLVRVRRLISGEEALGAGQDYDLGIHLFAGRAGCGSRTRLHR